MPRKRKCRTYPWREPKPANPVPMKKIKEYFEMPVFYKRTFPKILSAEELRNIQLKKIEALKDMQLKEIEVLKERMKKAGYSKDEIRRIIKAMDLKKG